MVKLGAVLKSLLKVAGKKDLRYYLNGVHIYRDPGALVMEATDGHRLMRVKCVNPDVYTGFDDDINVVLERVSLARALKLGTDLDLSRQGDIVLYGGVEIALHDCRYPDVERAMTLTDGSRPDIEKGVDIELMVSTATAIRDLMKAHNSKFITSKMKQTAADRSFVWQGDTADGMLIYTAHLMPCRM